MSASPTEALAEALRPLTADPRRAAVFCDIDGTLAPIVRRAEDAHVRVEVSVLLGRLARLYGSVACISGRSAAEARRLVGVGGIVGARILVPLILFVANFFVAGNSTDRGGVRGAPS